MKAEPISTEYRIMLRGSVGDYAALPLWADSYEPITISEPAVHSLGGETWFYFRLFHPHGERELAGIEEQLSEGAAP